jgi:predicted HTH transcriptional regulator
MKDKHFTFTLDQKMFEPGERDFVSEERSNLGYLEQQSIKDKRTPFNTMSFTNNKSPLVTFQPKKTSHVSTNLADREDRSIRIISLVKDKKDISIKDISLAFTDCSEKTIQRELNALVLKGKIKKTGSKRWSRYSVITN